MKIMTNTQGKLGNESRPFTTINKMKRQGPQDTKQNNVFTILNKELRRNELHKTARCEDCENFQACCTHHFMHVQLFRRMSFI